MSQSEVDEQVARAEVHNGGTGEFIRSIVAGDNITVDNTDPQNPIVAGEGGGGGSDVLHVQVVLTDAEIKTLPTLGKEILANPATGKVVSFVWATVQTNWNDANKYTNVATSGTRALVLWYSNFSYELSAYLKDAEFTAFFGSGSTYEPMMVEYRPYGDASGTGAPLARRRTLSDTKEQGVVLWADNNFPSAGAFTGGNAGNTMTVDLWYRLLDVPA